MGDSILMLDQLNAAMIAHYMGESAKREVDLVEDIKHAKWELDDKPNQYSLLLVEPFLYFNRDVSPLQKLMQESRTEMGLSVIVFSTQDEKTVNNEFLLKKGVHYDAYVSKWGPGSPEMMSKTFETLSLK